MEAKGAPNRKFSNVPLPAGGYPLAIRRPFDSGQLTAAPRYPPPGTQVRDAVLPGADVKQAAHAAATKTAWKRAAIAVHDNTTTTVAADAKRAARAGSPAANGDNRPIQPPRDKRRGWAPCVLCLAAASVLVLISTGYYLVHGHLPGHLRQPELLDVSQSSTPWTYATSNKQISTLNELAVAVNATELPEETDGVAPLESSSAAPENASELLEEVDDVPPGASSPAATEEQLKEHHKRAEPDC
ncbi:hypothetical protein MTO96_020728 [Rhipicephalus appendiculatus]